MDGTATAACIANAAPIEGTRVRMKGLRKLVTWRVPRSVILMDLETVKGRLRWFGLTGVRIRFPCYTCTSAVWNVFSSLAGVMAT
jgi:hypothetical protein